MKEIPLSRGMVALVDDDDFERVNRFKWHVTKGRNDFYAERNLRVNEGKGRQLLHSFLLPHRKGLHVDHINHNTLDNRRDNIRICTVSQNHMNRRKGTGTTSKYKGVYWHTAAGMWQVATKKNYKRIFIGYFKDEEDAARAYDAKATELFGEFALLNFPEAK